MRISDWSSDVGSSDLLDRAVLGDRAEAFGQFRLQEVIAQPRQSRPADFEPAAVRPVHVDFPKLGIEAIDPRQALVVAALQGGGIGELGRASCRERVWQYVQLSGVAG